MEQSLLRLSDGTLLYTRDLSPGEIEIARQKNPTCALCGEEGKITIPDRPMFWHQADHPPDEPERRKIISLLAKRLYELFPDGKQEQGMNLAGSWADLGMVRENGAKVAIQILGTQDTREKVTADWKQALLEKGTQALFLLDSRRLPVAAIKKQSGVRGVQISRAETNLLAIHEPLLYICPDGFLRAVAMPEALRGLAQTDSRVIGRMSAPVRVFRLDQLEIREGQWWFDPMLREDMLVPPSLPKGLKKRLQEKTGLV